MITTCNSLKSGINLNMALEACLSLLVVSLMILQSDASRNCHIPVHKRVECGTDLTTEADCQRESCCWMPCLDCPPHIPSCVKQGRTMRLGGVLGSRGRLEVYHNRKWGMVCGTNFGQKEAKAVCRQLGYRDLSQVTFSRQWTTRYGPQPILLPTIWLDNVQCPEGATSLVSCTHRPLGEHSCQPEDAVYVTCLSRTPMPCSIELEKLDPLPLEQQEDGLWRLADPKDAEI